MALVNRVVEVINALLCSDNLRFILALSLVIGTFALLFSHDDVPLFIVGLDGVAVGWFFNATSASR